MSDRQYCLDKAADCDRKAAQTRDPEAENNRVLGAPCSTISSSAACDGPYLHSVGRLPDGSMCWPMRVRADVNDAPTWQSRP
jgi:hypothetical protein